MADNGAAQHGSGGNFRGMHNHDMTTFTGNNQSKDSSGYYFPLILGKEQDWAFRVKGKLKELDTWNIITGDREKPEPPGTPPAVNAGTAIKQLYERKKADYEDFMRKHKTAYNYIFSCLCLRDDTLAKAREIEIAEDSINEV